MIDRKNNFVKNIFAKTFQKEVKMHLAEAERLPVLSTPSTDIDVAKRRARGQRQSDMRTRCGFSQRNIPEKYAAVLETTKQEHCAAWVCGVDTGYECWEDLAIQQTFPPTTSQE